MIVQPKTRGFICTTAHPAGCAAHVAEQVEYAIAHPCANGPKKVLVIGSSTGYGLATRITAAFSFGAATIGVAFERPASGSRTASAGWYNTAAFETAANEKGLYAGSIMGDAFSLEIKRKTIDLIKKDLGKVDLVVYSLAAPRRKTHEGETYSSALKPIGTVYSNKALDLATGQVGNASIAPATDEEIEGTRRVMGGEDWILWMDELIKADVLEKGAVTLAYSYIGPQVTHAIYREGTVGLAKKDLERSVTVIDEMLGDLDGKAYVSVNKAVVTQASAAIPAVPLYTSILFKIMKEKGLHEDCIEQMVRLFSEKLYGPKVITDEDGRLRVDDLEMREDVQRQVDKIWQQVNTENLKELADLNGYWEDFYKLFGFGLKGVDYQKDVEVDIAIPGLY